MPGDTHPPVRRSLGNGLTLRTPANDADIERVAQLNGIVHGDTLVDMVRNLAGYFPGLEWRDIAFVEDERTDEAVSTLMLIPWTLYYEDIAIPASEMAIVGTLEAYRRRGLVRAQTEYFKERLHERGCLISHIQGIPYYYRQFGYEYALPLEGGLRLAARELPPGPDETFTFRLATNTDIPQLDRFYKTATAELGIKAARTRAEWRYLLNYTQGTEAENATWLIEKNGLATGYYRLPSYHFGDELTVSEVSRLSYNAALSALHRLTVQASERGLPGVRLNLPGETTIMRAARSFGAHDLGTYAWQIHIPDMAAFLTAIGPVLERRIAESPFAGLSQQVHLCFYRDSVRLNFVAGRLTSIESAGPAEGDINFPPHAFIPLLLGHKTLDELHRAYPDLGVTPAFRLLIETLFPPMPSFLYAPY